jgi:hypothetical protein
LLRLKQLRKCPRTARPVCGIQFPTARLFRTKEIQMIRTTYLLGGMLTAMAAWLIYRGQQPRPVEVLAHRLEEAWADHHTRV